MPLYLLDSDILIDLMHGRRGRDNLVRNLILNKERLASCAVTVAELYSGILPKDVPKLEKLFRSLEYFDLTPDVARKAGLLRGEYRRKGASLSLADATLAALAMTEQMILVTANRKDFPMPDLVLYPLAGIN
jgi:predicted nucleic acid-binding protein